MFGTPADAHVFTIVRVKQSTYEDIYMIPSYLSTLYYKNCFNGQISEMALTPET